MGPAEKLIRDYFQAIADAVPSASLERFLHDDIRQHEFPSRLNPKGRTRGKAEMLADFEKGKGLIAKQAYAIRDILSEGDRIAVETGWEGTLAVDLGTLKAGDSMRADFAVFFRLKDGRILAQDNYDCIHPW